MNAATHSSQLLIFSPPSVKIQVTEVNEVNTAAVQKNQDLHARYARYKNILKNFTIMHDVFMRNVFKKKECTEYVLRIIMDMKDLKVDEQVIQKDYKNLQGRSAILDCVARDGDGKLYNVEVQQDHEGASPKRARYHIGLMDMNVLKAGQDFEELPESYVIFITRDDAIGSSLPIYHIDRTIRETDEEFMDESHIIYVNSSIQDDTELGRLAHDLHCKNADEMYSEILAKRVRELKETQKGVENMCREMDEIYREGVEEGREQGREQGKMDILLNLVKEGLLSISDAAKKANMEISAFEKTYHAYLK